MKPDLAGLAADALKGSIKLSNEIIGTMSLIERGIPIPEGIIAAMRRYARDAGTYVDALERTQGRGPGSAQVIPPANPTGARR